VLDKANDPWRESLRRAGVGQSAYQVKDAQTNSAACDYLRRTADARRKGDNAPFCLTVGYLLPHPPYVAWRADFARFAGRVPAPAYPEPPDNLHLWEAWWRENRGIRDVSQQETMRARTAYYALVYRLDVMIGEVLRCLAECGLADNTMVVYSTDHGDQLGERGLWWKHTLYEESIRVPAIMRWPGQLPAGVRKPQVANLIDVAATMVDGLGGSALPHGRGRSLLDVARGSETRWNDVTFSEHCTDTVPAWTGGRSAQQRMIRDGDWKLIYHRGDSPQLFDLAADPDERTDLASDPRHAAVRERLLARVLDGWDPALIAARIEARRLDKNVVDGWARNTRPPDEFRWDMLPEYNQLESQSG
jgi:choline-sulfatase